MIDHRDIDRRSLAFGRAIAEKLTQRPELAEHARSNLDRWMLTVSEGTKPALREWLDALNGPLEGVLDLLTAETEHATQLRQSNPFAGVLSQTERNEIMNQFPIWRER
jgi:hypothetical protein